MKVEPREFILEEIGPENAKIYLDSLKEMMDSEGFLYLKRLVDSIAYTSYLELLSKNDHSTMMYAKGMIGGLESLMQSLDVEVENLSYIVKESINLNSDMEENSNEDTFE